MSYRFMRALVFFDLPTETGEDRRNYTRFRKFLIKNGFVMLQESVYTRMLLTPTHGESVLKALRENNPPKGLVQVLLVTEKQFSKMECICGEYKSDVIDSDSRMIVI